jgi:hypothetical protein
MEKDNNPIVPSRATALIADYRVTWHTIADSRRRPKYHMWPKDN